MKNFGPYIAALVLSACTVHSSDAPAKQPSVAPAQAAQAKAEPSVAAPSVAEPVVPEPKTPALAERCKLPPVTGPCRAMMRSFHYDVASGSCKYFVYGGCDGNANRFPTVGECLSTCGVTPELAAIADRESGASTIACLVGSSYYATGATVTEEDGATCVCRAGKLESCTKPRTCPDGKAPSTTCAQKGPSGCLVMKTACPT